METIDKKLRHHLMNLFTIAIADNNVDPNELNFLYQIGIENGITQEQIDEIIANPQKQRFVLPTSPIDAITQLYDIITMVLIDKKIHPFEVSFSKSFALKLGISEIIIDELIEKLIEEISSGRSKESIISEITQIL